MAMTARAAVLSLSRYLRKYAPTTVPIKIHLINIPKESQSAGIATIGPKKAHIRIDNTMSRPTQIDTLLHEWAHIRVGWNIKEHTREFWIDHGRLYELYLKWHKQHEEKL